MPKYSAIVPTRDTQGDLDEMDMPAGSESILAIDQVRPAGEIVADVIADARHVIEHGPGHA
jgi:enoyl-[acyl-carrier protein] reductase II